MDSAQASRRGADTGCQTGRAYATAHPGSRAQPKKLGGSLAGMRRFRTAQK